MLLLCILKPTGSTALKTEGLGERIPQPMALPLALRARAGLGSREFCSSWTDICQDQRMSTLEREDGDGRSSSNVSSKPSHLCNRTGDGIRCKSISIYQEETLKKYSTEFLLLEHLNIYRMRKTD